MTHRLLPFLALPALLGSTSFEASVRTGDTPAEPVFDPAQSRMLFSENFDNYSFEKLHPKCGSADPPHAIRDHSWEYCKQFSPGYDGSVITVPGRAGGGLAVQWHYDGKNQETHGVQTTATSVTPTGKATTVVQYWARYHGDPGHSLTSTDERGVGNAIVQIKNIMLWHDQNRFQIDLHSHQGGCPVYGPSYTMLEVIDQVDGGCNSSQPVGPFFKNYADGEWHRWTILYKPNTAQGSRDGRASLWIDGKLVIRIEKSALGVTPPGGWKPWCTAEELDALYSGSYGVGTLEWGANRTDESGIPFTMAIDDVRWWVAK